MADFNLGQHFMIDRKAILRLVSHVPEGKVILEIGPGTGILSRELKSKAKKLILIERDKRFEPYLKDYDVIFDNVLEMKKLPKFEVVVSNLPFNIVEPLFFKLLRVDFEEAYLTISKRTYKKLTSRTSKLGHIVSHFFDIEKLEEFDKDSFYPQPRVRAVLVRVRPKKDGDSLVKKFLRMYDKKVKNALIDTFIGIKTKNQVRELFVRFDEAVLNTRVRNISLEDLKRIEAMLLEEERNLRRKESS